MFTLTTSLFAGPARMSSKEMPENTPVCDWSGFYLGLNVGAGNLKSYVLDRDYYEGYDTRVLQSDGFMGGGQLGYNFQTGNLVFGFEVDGDGSTAERKYRTDSSFSTNSVQEERGSVDFLGTARLRLGVAFQNALVYVTGGGAYANGDWRVRWYEPANPTYQYNESWNGDDWRWGWTSGAGVEYMLGCHWTLRAEYLYTWLEDDTVRGSTPNLAPGATRDREEGFRYTFSDEMWNLRVGLNYKFGGFFGH
jgi:outer membrane immunogenic protein